MFEILIVVFVGGIYLYKRKVFRNSQSQTEMVVLDKSTQTDSESDSMSLDLSDMSYSMDMDFFNRAFEHET